MARALLWGTATLGLVACTDGASERTITTTVPAATTTSFETLPPVGVFNYPTGSDDVIAQISVDLDAPIAMPLLTIYGSGRTIAAVDDQWRTGSITDLDLQDFFDDARSIGLLDDDLVLRGRIESEQPNIAVFFDVDGRRLNHELDLVRIERPASMRAFLQRAATSNLFELTDGYEPATWINCVGGVCTVADEPGDDFARPVLPHDDVGTLAAAAGIGQP
jgi:hypothetical protein